MAKNLFRFALGFAIIFSCLACAAQRPVLAPNEHLQEMAPEAVQRDIDDCIQQAREAGPGRGASSSPGKPQGVQLWARRLARSREQSPEVLESVLRLGRPAEPRRVFCVDSSNRMIWMPGSGVMLRTVSARKGTTPSAGASKMTSR